jgi:hypothetical protein
MLVTCHRLHPSCDCYVNGHHTREQLIGCVAKAWSSRLHGIKSRFHVPRLPAPHIVAAI